MSEPITPLSLGAASAAPSASGAIAQARAGDPMTGAKAMAPSTLARDPRADKLRHAATEFESMMVKQLLKSAKLGGGADDKTNGYGDMAVDALASSVERGGGFGLARRIEDAIGNAHRVTWSAAGASRCAAIALSAASPADTPPALPTPMQPAPAAKGPQQATVPMDRKHTMTQAIVEEH